MWSRILSELVFVEQHAYKIQALSQRCRKSPWYKQYLRIISQEYCLGFYLLSTMLLEFMLSKRDISMIQTVSQVLIVWSRILSEFRFVEQHAYGIQASHRDIARSPWYKQYLITCSRLYYSVWSRILSGFWFAERKAFGIYALWEVYCKISMIQIVSRHH